MGQKLSYIHGTKPEEQLRLSLLNDLTNTSFLNFLDINDNSRILEIGSGLGVLTSNVARLSLNSSVIGIENASDQISKVITIAGSIPNLEFIKGDALVLPFKGSSFDTVYCRYLLEHVHNPEMVINEAFRVLKPSGRIFIQENNILINTLDPDCPAYSLVLKKFIHLQAQMGGDGEIGKRLFKLLKQKGFESINISIEPEVHHHDMPTYDGWIRNSIDILKGASHNLLQLDGMSESLLRESILELENLRTNPFGAAYFYWNRASAQKPLHSC